MTKANDPGFLLVCLSGDVPHVLIYLYTSRASTETFWSAEVPENLQSLTLALKGPYSKTASLPVYLPPTCKLLEGRYSSPSSWLKAQYEGSFQCRHQMLV